MTILDAIAAQKRDEVRALPTLEPGALPRASRSFLAAIAAPGLSLIAEIKQRSPSTPRPADAAPFDPARLAATYDASARAISVLTDGAAFGGALEHLDLASRASTRPILCKDFVVDPAKQIPHARAHGADAILLMAQLLSSEELERGLGLARALGMECLVETHDDHELARVLDETSAAIVGINARDLRTLAIDLERPRRMAARARAAGRLVVAESGLRTRADVRALEGRLDAILVGTALAMSPDPAGALVELGYPPRTRAPGIKLCGLRTVAQARAADGLGVEAIGLNFVPGARRRIDDAEAVRLGALALDAKRVGVFVAPPIGEVERRIDESRLDAIQLHGLADSGALAPFAALCRDRDLELLVAVEVTEPARARRVIGLTQALGGRIVLDGARSGSGRAIDRSLLSGLVLPRDLVLAGGLEPSNVREAVAAFEPAMLDVASGIEVDGAPSAERMAAFVYAARGGRVRATVEVSLDGGA